MSNQLVSLITQMVGDPVFMANTYLSNLHPTTHKQFLAWANRPGQDVSAASVYRFLQPLFHAPILIDGSDQDIEELYSELCKCIIASALGVEYKGTGPRLITH